MDSNINKIYGYETAAGKNYLNVEFSRFVGIIMIMGHHLYHIGYTDSYLFYGCWAWVDYFFILSGAFTYIHYQRISVIENAGREAISYTLKKFYKFLPYVLVATTSEYIVQAIDVIYDGNILECIKSFRDFPFEILLLSSSGIVSAKLAPIWYLSALFIIMPLVCYLMNTQKEFWQIISFIYPIIYFGKMGVNTIREWPNDLLRAFACIALGTLVVQIGIFLKTHARSSVHVLILAIVEGGGDGTCDYNYSV